MDKTKDKIDEYIDIIRKVIDIDTVIIFGSFLNPGFNAENSDIDILIVSNDFKNMSKLDAYKIVSDPLWDLKINIDPIPVSKDEIRNHDSASFISEIIRTGKVFYKKTA